MKHKSKGCYHNPTKPRKGMRHDCGQYATGASSPATKLQVNQPLVGSQITTARICYFNRRDIAGCVDGRSKRRATTKTTTGRNRGRYRITTADVGQRHSGTERTGLIEN